MKILIIVQARINSSRLAKKVLLPLCGKPMILFQLERLSQYTSNNMVVLATSNEPSDDQLARIVIEAGIDVFRGSLDNVLNRYLQCATVYSADTIVRITGDCPFTDPLLVHELIEEFASGEWDYLSNSADDKRLSVPDGMDIEVFSYKALARAEKAAQLRSEKEHVTLWMRRKDSGLRWKHFVHSPWRKFYRVTVDDEKDYLVASSVANALYPTNPNFSVDDVVKFLNENPLLAMKNAATVRNEGLLKSITQD